MSNLYDETRIVDGTVFNLSLDYLVERFPPAKFPSAFEPGIGTGRIAIPLAERGYRVTGVDISDEMLAKLAGRLEAYPMSLPISFKKGDVTELPFADGTFDLTIVVHVFYFYQRLAQSRR